MKVIVLDIDGILINNKISNIFRNFSNFLWLGEKPWLKRIFLRMFEIIEMCLIFFGFKHIINKSIIDVINDAREKDPSLSLFIMTNRSLSGVKNIHNIFYALHLGERDFIQARGDPWNSLQRKMWQLLEIRANIIFSSAIKPELDVLLHLIAIVDKEDASNSKKVLVIDDDINFLESVESRGFAIFPNGMYFSKNKEVVDDIAYYLERYLDRRFLE